MARSRVTVGVEGERGKSLLNPCRILVGVMLAAAFPTAGQMRTDASLGRAAATLQGPNYLVSQDLGRVVGSNLFHSFETFNVGFAEVARFTTTTPGIANIISRVTGGDISRINGTISVEAAGGGAPAFWFLNPAGVVFGPGSAINVPGAFRVSTANYLKFADGEFHADPSRASTFSAFAPEAFGFLGTTRASIRVEDGAQLRTNAPVQLVAGDIAFTRGTLSGGEGDIRVVAFGGQAGEVALSGAVPEALGDVVMFDGGAITTHAAGRPNAGNIELYAGSLTLDGAGSGDRTGLASFTELDAPGNTGSITVGVNGTVTILNGAAIATETSSSGHAGTIHVSAQDLFIDGKGVDDTGILSLSREGATGRGGDVTVEVGGALQMFNGAVITSDTESGANAGSVKVSADSLLIDGLNTVAFTGISSDTRKDSTGSAGRVDGHVDGLLTIVRTGDISSSTYGNGNAGAVSVFAGSLLIDGNGNQDFTTGIHSAAFDPGVGNAGDVDVRVKGTATIIRGGDIGADTWTIGRGGNVSVSARNMLLDGRPSDLFTGISADSVLLGGHGGSVDVRVAETLTVRGAAQISSDTLTAGNGGTVRVEAPHIVVDGRGGEGGGITSFTTGSGSAGNVTVIAGDLLEIVNGGLLSSGAAGTGAAGSVDVTAKRLLIDGRDLPQVFTGIASQSNEDLSGPAGDIRVNVAQDASIVRGGGISTSTFSHSRAGTVSVTTGGDLTIRDGQHSFTGITSGSSNATAGPAGDVTVNVGGALTLANVVSVSSNTSSASTAGSVHVTANTLSIDGSDAAVFTGISSDAVAGSSGAAGNVYVDVHGNASIVSSGRISSLTFGSGDAGTVSMHAGTLSIEARASQWLTGLSTQSASANSGNAGDVVVTVDGALSVAAGGSISSATFSSAGRAGSVDVTAGSVLVSGARFVPSSIIASAQPGSSGQTGSVTITATDSITVSDGGRISIGNGATVDHPAVSSDSGIQMTAPDIRIERGGMVTAASSGNVAASDIHLDVPGTLALDHGSIATTANLGNGGAITIRAGAIDLRDSQITTSVSGTTGNGGDITVQADVLRMETGFIQANTAAADASGGNVTIDARVLAASGSSLFVGGSEPLTFRAGVFGLNVIQAAAPTGVSGAIDLTSPVLDTSGALAGLGAAALDTSGVGRSPCRVSAGSSLAIVGRGGLAPSALGMQRVDPASKAASLAGARDPLVVSQLESAAPCR